jgi:hypothetical protein
MSTASGTSPLRRILPFAALLLAVAAGCAWLAWRAVEQGEVRLLSRHATHRMITRQDQPALFWVNVGVLASLGLGSLGSAAWMLAQTRESTPR